MQFNVTRDLIPEKGTNSTPIPLYEKYKLIVAGSYENFTGIYGVLLPNHSKLNDMGF